MYYADLSKYPDLEDSVGSYLCIGWLDNKHSYTQGAIDNHALDRLWEFCRISIFVSLGYHECEFCKNPQPTVSSLERNSNKLYLGSAELLVLGSDHIIYVAPDLIYHYVTQHNYLPPEKFVEALINSPLPNSLEYNEEAKQYSWYDYYNMERGGWEY